jgi:hypothetical protein
MKSVTDGPQNTETLLSTFLNLQESSSTPIEWLVICHRDPATIRRLGKVLDGKSAAVLQLPQTEWDVNGTEFAELLDRAISTGNVRHVLVVGHSQVASDETTTLESKAIEPTESLATPSIYERFVRNADRLSKQTELSKQLLTEQIGCICANAKMLEAVKNDQIKLHALLFLAHSGEFLLFNIGQQTFQPIS